MTNRREFELIPDEDKGGRSILTEDMKEILETLKESEFAKETQEQESTDKQAQSDKIRKIMESDAVQKTIKYIQEKQFDESFVGGLADGRKIADFDIVQLAMGVLIEIEHTNNFLQAMEISMDHLIENDKYYTYLYEMEDKMEEAAAISSLILQKEAQKRVKIPIKEEVKLEYESFESVLHLGVKTSKKSGKEPDKPKKVTEIADAIRRDNPGTSDEVAYRMAWESYCSYVNPGYEGCTEKGKSKRESPKPYSKSSLKIANNDEAFLASFPDIVEAIGKLKEHYNVLGIKKREPHERWTNWELNTVPINDYELKDNADIVVANSDFKVAQDIVIAHLEEEIKNPTDLGSVSATKWHNRFSEYKGLDEDAKGPKKFLEYYDTLVVRGRERIPGTKVHEQYKGIRKDIKKKEEIDDKKKEIEQKIRDGYEGRLEDPTFGSINQGLMDSQLLTLDKITDIVIVRKLYKNIMEKAMDKTKALNMALNFQNIKLTNANLNKKEKEAMSEKKKKDAYFQGTQEPDLGNTFQMGDEQKIREEDKQMVGKGMESGSEGMHPGYEMGSDEQVKEMLMRAENRKKMVQSYFQGTVEPEFDSTFQMGDEQKIRQEDKQMVGKGIESGSEGMHPGYEMGSDEKVKEMLQRAKSRSEFVKSQLNKKAQDSCEIIRLDREQVAEVCPECVDSMEKKNLSHLKFDLNEMEPEVKEAFLKISKKEKCSHMNKDGTFKGGFDGCVSHFESKCGGSKSEESAKKLCGYIKKRKFGEFLSAEYIMKKANCGTSEKDKKKDEEEKMKEKKNASMNEKIIKKAQGIAQSLAEIADQLDKSGAHAEATQIDTIMQGLADASQQVPVTESLQEIQENRQVEEEIVSPQITTPEAVQEEGIPSPEVIEPEIQALEYDEITIDEFQEYIDNLKFPLSHRQKKEQYEKVLEKITKAKEYKEAYEKWLEDAHKDLEDEPIRFKF